MFQIKEIPITKDMIEWATRMSDNMGVLKGSFTKGKGNLYGAMGEIMVSEYLSRPIESTYDYDIVLSDGSKIDVKTKRTKVRPKLNYDCSISNWNTKQRCDYYVFCRVKTDLSVGWILGYYDKVKYMEDSIFLKKGTVDESNGYSVRSDCYNLKIDLLSPIEKLLHNEIIDQPKKYSSLELEKKELEEQIKIFKKYSYEGDKKA
jgi:hypothetical protein|tara:strand:+ start:1321 stop:1932 length:612 start_codon:yes stop_codon:yes gene_type:complete